MNECLINKARTCAVTGHRVLPKNVDVERLNLIFNKLIEGGFDTFLIGMAIGFDTLCFQTLEKIKKEKKDIKIIACIPCENQFDRFTDLQKKEWERMVLSSDGKVVLSKNYNSRCMQKRNQFMVDNCSVLVAYLRRDYGGTKKTVEYAKNNDVCVIYL